MDTKDHCVFLKAGIVKEYESVGDLNLFMVLKDLDFSAERALPEGFSYRKAYVDELDKWKHTARLKSRMSFKESIFCL